MSELIGFGAGGQSAAKGAYLETQSSTANGTGYTFSSVSFGAAASDRYIVACIYGAYNGAPSSVTIGGVSATKVVDSGTVGTDNWHSTIYIAPVPSGTSGNIVIAGMTSALRCAMSAYRVVGLNSATPVDTDSDADGVQSITLTLDAVQNGFMLACCVGSSDSYTEVTSGITEDSNIAVESDGFSCGSSTEDTGGAKTIVFKTGSIVPFPATAAAIYLS